jgi:hypothetical protein
LIRQDRHLESLVSQPGPPPLKPRAYQLTEAAQVAGNLSTIVGKPTNEAQVRPPTGLEPEQQREVWDKAVETALPSSTPGGRVKVVLNDGDKNLIASSTQQLGIDTGPIAEIDGMPFADPTSSRPRKSWG